MGHKKYQIILMELLNGLDHMYLLDHRSVLRTSFVQTSVAPCIRCRDQSKIAPRELPETQTCRMRWKGQQRQQRTPRDEYKIIKEDLILVSNRTAWRNNSLDKSIVSMRTKGLRQWSRWNSVSHKLYIPTRLYADPKTRSKNCSPHSVGCLGRWSCAVEGVLKIALKQIWHGPIWDGTQ